MRRNLQMRDANNGESEGINRSYSEHLLMDLRKTVIPIVEDCISKGGIHSVEQVVDDSFQKVKDEIHSMVEEKLIYQNWNSKDEATTSVPRDFVLKFLVQVSDPVLTGKEIRGKEGTDIKIAIVDKVTEVPVGSEPQSSAKVEIYILDASVEDFDDSSINIANDKPYFRNRVFVDLKKGVGILPKNVKLAHRSRWTKSCECRLGARVVKNLGGSGIKEALTDSFTVLDRRSKLNKKHDQPSLFDDVWRLKNIGKNGPRHNRLRNKNVSKVQEFLFLLYVDPQRLQEIFGASPGRWKSTVDHALKCDIDDKKMYLHYSSSSECKNGVVFNVVGQLKGVMRNGGYVPIDTVAENEKEDARKLLAYAFENQKEAPASENKKKASAFENWNDIDTFDDEDSFLCKFPSISSDENATNSAFENRTDMASFDDEDGASSMCKFPSISNDENATNYTGLDGPFGHYDFGNPDDLYQPLSGFPNSFSDLLPWSDDDYYQMDSYLSETRMFESNSDQQSIKGKISIVGVTMTLRWRFRVKKRFAFLGNERVRKRQRHG